MWEKAKMLMMLMFIGLCIITGNNSNAEAEGIISNNDMDCVTGSAVKAWLETDKYVTSGIYTYRVINENTKEIEIRGINSTKAKIEIPQEIDGYRVISIGYYGDVSHPGSQHCYNADDLSYIGNVELLKVKGCESTLSEIKLPESIKYIGACAFRGFGKLNNVKVNDSLAVMYGRCFEGCKSLKNINIPDGTFIGQYAFYGCESLKKITLTPENYSDSGCIFNCGEFDEIHFTGKGRNSIDTLVCIDIYTFGSDTVIKKVIVDKQYERVLLNKDAGVLVIKGKNTRVTTDRGRDAFADTRIDTVKGAKAISFAKNNKMSYRVKQKSRVTGLKRTKSGNRFLFRWKKSKPKVELYKYNKSSKKWTKKGTVKYKVYGFNSKKEKTKYLGTTGKAKYKTGYKGIKVEVV